MNIHKLCTLGLVSTSLFLVGCVAKEQAPTDEASKNNAEIVLHEEKEEATVTYEPIDVAMIGDVWDKTSDVTYVQTSWEKPLPKNVRFILIDSKTSIDQTKQKQLQTWAEEDKVILFYGEAVQPEDVQKKIGMDMATFAVHSNSSMEFPYLVFGFGFSKTYKQYMPLFLSSNSPKNFEEKIATFLLKNQNF